MTFETRKPFVDPIVSEPIDALQATRAFGGQLGQIVLGGGTSGTAMDDGDYALYSDSYDPTCQDAGADGSGCSSL